MNALTPERFPEFFSALYDRSPFPWQQSLATRASSGDWPACIALPTASGKTACIDIAVFALACQAGLPAGKRTAPRRIFFVVDRRVIVDEAYERARVLADKLERATDGILKQVADALRRIAGPSPDGLPLDVRQLRGGIYRDDSWVRSLTQPTVVASTVDQVGSRLLFRGYGVSDSVKPIHAALVGNDSLIILDEAHCARPFRETLQSVARYRSAAWSDVSLGLPFHVVEMSATPRDSGEAFRLGDGDLAHPVLAARRRAAKPARLIIAERAKGAKAMGALADCLLDVAEEIAGAEPRPRSVAVIVNRVKTARMLYKKLEETHQDARHLMVGRMRPIDRDALTKSLQQRFGSGRTTDASEETQFVVATQCLEVGADFDFDAMVCECASLDALRQRFGRLNRMGRQIPARAAVVIAAQSESARDPDPIYGEALAKTWRWLNSQSQDGVVDFGIEAMEQRWQAACNRDPGLAEDLLAPAPHAPVMLPAHLDCWCQTSPMPVPDPDVSLFLHGPEQGQPEVQLCWRADLGDPEDQGDLESAWTQAVSLCPPTSAECLSVPLWLVRQWLTQAQVDADAYTDVLGGQDPTATEATKKQDHPGRIGLLWRGPAGSTLVNSAHGVRPGDTLVLPVSAGGWSVFGHIPDAPADTAKDAPVESSAARTLDCGSQAYVAYHRKHILRLHPRLWPEQGALAGLLAWACNPDDERSAKDVKELLGQAADLVEHEAGDSHSDLAETLRALANPGNRIQIDRYHRGAGAVLKARRRMDGRDYLEADDGDDSTSRTEAAAAVPLAEHLAGVARRAASLTDGLGPLSSAVAMAAQCHDLGKAEPRFQAYLRLSTLPDDRLWAKHPNAPVSLQEHRLATLRSGRPEGWRHELLSVALVQSRLGPDAPERDLVLHLIAAHHGRCRPFAPAVADPSPVEVRVTPDGTPADKPSSHALAASSATGLERLDSGVAERFWMLIRRHGWWGLPYLETCVRLADWLQSADEAGNAPPSTDTPIDVAAIMGEAVPPPKPQAELVLRGLDGANPLAFLAALGTLRVLTGAWPGRHVRLSWRQHAGAWRPVIHADGDIDGVDMVRTLHCRLAAMAGSPAFTLGDNIGVPPDVFRDYALKAAAEAQQSPPNRVWADFAAAFACESVLSQTSKDPTVEDTALRTMSGSGHQHFLKFFRDIVAATDEAHIESALLREWDYGDPGRGLNLRWDPADDRRYALRAVDPSTDPITTMRGANRLAIEAMPLLPVVPCSGRLLTTAFRGRGSRDTFLVWPVWGQAIDLDACRSWLANAAISDQPDAASREELERMTAITVYRSRRITTGKFRNFTPAETL